VTGQPATGPPDPLFRRWVHVREQDEPGVRVYRPAGHPVPPARGRDGIEFRPDGTVIHYSPGPTDAPVGRASGWRAAGPTALVIRSGGDEKRYDILTVTDDLLRLRTTG
jgi:hypothetical protein